MLELDEVLALLGVTNVITLVVPAGSLGTIVVRPVCVAVEVRVVKNPVGGGTNVMMLVVPAGSDGTIVVTPV